MALYLDLNAHWVITTGTVLRTPQVGHGRVGSSIMGIRSRQVREQAPHLNVHFGPPGCSENEGPDPAATVTRRVMTG